MSTHFLYILCACLSIYPLYAAQHPPLPEGTYTIEEVHIVDAQGTPPSSDTRQAILDLLDIPCGTTLNFPSPRIDQALIALWQHGYVVEINAQSTQADTLTLELVILQTYATLGAVHWHGLSVKAQNDIATQLHLTEGKPWLPHLQEAMATHVESHCRKQGYRHAQVSLHTTTIDPNTVDLHVHVHKHDPYYLGRIAFQSPDSMDTYALAQHLSYSRQGVLPHYNAWHKRLFQNVRRGYFGNIFRDIARLTKLRTPRFVEDKVQKDAQRLALYYKNQGFLDAKVYYALEEENDCIHVTFHLEPGACYTVGDIQWIGNTLLSSAYINESLSFYPGQAYRAADIEAALQPSLVSPNLHTLYQQTEVPLYVVANMQVQGIVGDQVYLQGYIQELPHPTITQLHIRTAGKVKKSIVRTILAEHGIVEGATLTPAKLFACRQHLLQTGLFRPQTIALTPTPIAPQQVRIDVYAIAGESIDFDIGMEGYQFKLALNKPNFDLAQCLRGKKPSGAGQTVSVHAGFHGLSFPYLGLSFSDPWHALGEQRTPLRWQAFGKYDRDKGMHFQSDFYASRPYQAPYPHSYTQRLSITRHHLDAPYNTQPTLDTLLFQTSYTEDSTDHPYAPTRGYKLLVQGSLTHPLGRMPSRSSFYPQGLLQGSYFKTPPSSRVTWYARATLGVARRDLPQSPMGKFVLGNSPFTIPVNQLVHPSIFPFRGTTPVPEGTTYIGYAHGSSATLELRYRLAERPLIYGIVFLDAAYVGQDYLGAIGAEIRIFTPLCIVSAYVFYPNPTRPLGLGMRLMPLQENA